MIPGVHVGAAAVRTGTNPVKGCWVKNLLNKVCDSEDPRRTLQTAQMLQRLTVALVKASVQSPTSITEPPENINLSIACMQIFHPHPLPKTSFPLNLFPSIPAPPL